MMPKTHSTSFQTLLILVEKHPLHELDGSCLNGHINPANADTHHRKLNTLRHLSPHFHTYRTTSIFHISVLTVPDMLYCFINLHNLFIVTINEKVEECMIFSCRSVCVTFQCPEGRMVAKHLQHAKNTKLQLNDHLLLGPALLGLTHPPVFAETRYKIVNLVQRHAKQALEFPVSISRRPEICTILCRNSEYQFS